MAALDARHIHEPGRAAQQRPAGESELRHRLPAALGEGARAVGEALAALEGAAHQRMRLEALEFLERREVWIFVVEMHHEADGNEIVVEMIEERTAAGSAVERPAECVLDQARLMFLGRDLPQLLQAKPEFLRCAAFVEAEALQQRLAEIAARAFGEQRVFRAQLHAAGEAVLVMAVLGHTHIAGGNARNRAVVIKQHLGGGKAGIDFDAQRFRLGCEPAADVAEGDDVVAVIVHQRRHHEAGQTHRARGRKPIEAVIADLGLDRRILVSPVRNELVETDRDR